MTTQLVVFHARPGKGNPNPTHTLCFSNKDGVLLCTYSKPHPGADSYCKATGSRIVTNRMNTLIEETTSDSDLLSGMIVAAKMPIERTIKSCVPACVRKTLKYYAKLATRYFKIADRNPVVIIRSYRPDWKTWMNSNQKVKVPIRSVIISRYLEDL